jgi:hypothetical protein
MATANPPMTEIGIAHLCQPLTSGFDNFPAILETGRRMLSTKTTKTIAAKIKITPLV